MKRTCEWISGKGLEVISWRWFPRNLHVLHMQITGSSSDVPDYLQFRGTFFQFPFLLTTSQSYWYRFSGFNYCSLFVVVVLWSGGGNWNRRNASHRMSIAIQVLWNVCRAKKYLILSITNFLSNSSSTLGKTSFLRRRVSDTITVERRKKRGAPTTGQC